MSQFDALMRERESYYGVTLTVPNTGLVTPQGRGPR